MSIELVLHCRALCCMWAEGNQTNQHFPNEIICRWMIGIDRARPNTAKQVEAGGELRKENDLNYDYGWP